MPRDTRQQITPRGAPQGQSSQGVQARAAAQGTEHIPNYIPQNRDPTLQGLLEGLRSVSPVIDRQLQEVKQAEAGQATTDRLAGREQQSDSWNYTEHYLHTDGVVKGQQDGAALQQAYQTKFDKDGGDIDAFLRDEYEGMVKGVKPGPFLIGHDKYVGATIAAIRKDHLDYQRNAVTSRVESNAMALLGSALKEQDATGASLPDDKIIGLQDYLSKNLGVSKGRFDELLFTTVQTRAMEGDFTAFDLLKRPRPDGSPGLYDDPQWRHKIETAENTAYSASETRSRKDREGRQETALYSVFTKLYDGQATEARTEFETLKKNNLFSRASDLIKYEELFSKVQNKEARIDQQTSELELQAKIYTGKAGINDVLRADLTASQKRSLIGEAYKVRNDARTAAAQADKEGKAIFRSSEFRSGEDYIRGALASTPHDADPTGVGTVYERQQRATALLEFTQAAQRAQSPGELPAVREEIVHRHLKMRKDTERNRHVEGVGLLRFGSPAETAAAARQGLLTVDEVAHHLRVFKDSRYAR